MLRRRLLAAPFAQDAAPIRVEVSLVNVPFAVLDRDGRLVSDLATADFEVYEDGAPQKISFFSRAADSALALTIVSDVSPSQEDFLKDHRRDLHDFLRAILRPRDKASLVCFGADAWEVSPPDSHAGHLEDALKEFQKAKRKSEYRKIHPPEHRENASSVHDAVVAAARQFRGEEGRRALVLFSDGEDTSSAYTLLDAIETAQEFGVTVFALRYTRTRKGEYTARNKQGRATMQRLASETGGLEFDTATEGNLREAFAQIAATLRSSYMLGYSSTQPTPDGTFRKISIRCRREGLKVRHKTGYYARLG